MSKNWKSGPLHIWPNKLRKGEKRESHRHSFGHTTFAMRGTFIVRLHHSDDRVETLILNCPGEVYVPAMCLHEVEATTEEAEFWCVFYDEAPGNV